MQGMDKEQLMEAFEAFLKEKYHLSLTDLTQLTSDTIPCSIFTPRLGALEAIVKYLREQKKYSYEKIAELLYRNKNSLMTTYHKAVKKYPEALNVVEGESFPLSIFSNVTLSVLEAIVLYFKQKKYSLSQIGRLLKRDDRTIWTIYHRASKKEVEKHT